MPINIGRLTLNPWTMAAGAVFLLSAYLCLANLDYATFWHDEAPAAFLGKMLLQHGDFIGWDGRSLVGGTNGRTLNAELRDTLPPLTYFINAAGFALFGVNEIGARLPHALIGLLALALFWLLLRRHLPQHPRLVFLIFLFSAQSAQLLLYFRQSRYFATMAFCLIALFYLYESYWRSKKTAPLIGLTIVALLAFFNHYVAGTVSILSVAAWHLLYRARQTTLAEYGRFAAVCLIVACAGTAYFFWLGILGGEREGGFLAYTGTIVSGRDMDLSLLLLKVFIYMRDMFAADWLSLPIIGWFAYMLTRRFFGTRKKKKQKPRLPPDDTLPLAATTGLIVAGLLFALLSALLSVQPVWAHAIADLRYYFAAIPFLLAMKALFVEWLWRKNIAAAAGALAVLLFTNIAATPFHFTNPFTNQSTIGAPYFQFWGEIHRPYPSAARAVADFLRNNAAPDDLVYVPAFYNREMLTFYAGDHVRFCCILNRQTPLPAKALAKMDAPIFIEQSFPDWALSFDGPQENYDSFVLATVLNAFPYPTQRPEINFHLFAPPSTPGVYIYRRR